MVGWLKPNNNSTEIEKQFVKEAEKEAENIKHPVLRQNLFNGINEAVIDFRLSVNNHVASCDRKLLRLITIEADQPVVTDDNLEKLREMHRTYVSPAEAELFELHKKIAADLTTLFENTDSSLYGAVYMSRFFIAEDGKFVPNHDTNYSSLLKQEQAISE